MHFIPYIALSYFTLVVALPDKKNPRADSCRNDSCARKILDSYGGSEELCTVKSDCVSFMQATVTVPQLTVSVSETIQVTTTVSGISKRTLDPRLPFYASNCSDALAYSHACSCFGVTATTITISQPTSMTTTEVVTETTTKTATSTISSSPPACTADTLTDPQNCGHCGNVCSSGICEAGSCADSGCSVQSCGNFNQCGKGDGECYCFSSAKSEGKSGFCGQNAICSGLTACASDADCKMGSSGNICAISTCCPPLSSNLPGVCLAGQCSNPSRKLIRMAKMQLVSSGTAAF